MSAARTLCGLGSALVLAVAAGPAHALDPGKTLTQYVHQVWQTEQGLPQNTVLALCQTRDGYVWLGTQEGLARFDGVRFTVFDKNNTPELKHNWITALREDRQGNLWIGVNGGGLVRLRGGHFDTFTTREGLADDRVRSIYEDHAGSLWVGTSGGGVSRWRNGSFTTFTTKDGLSSDQVVAIEEDGDGSLWFGTFDGGLTRFKDGRFSVLTRKDGLSSDSISSIVADKAGRLWVGTFEGGLDRLDNGRVTVFTTKQGLPSDQIWTLATDRDGSLWIATSGGGLGRLDNGRFTRLTTKQGLSSDEVSALLEDREGGLWVGTFQGGVNRFEDGKFTPLTAQEGLGSDVVRAIYEDRSGDVWIGTAGGGLSRVHAGRLTTLTTRDGLGSDDIAALAEDKSGSLWIGTLGGGLSRLRDGRFTSLTTKQGLSNDAVLAIEEDSEGALWVGTDGGGLNRLRDGRVTAFTKKQGLGADRVVAIHADGNGTVWFATAGGLSRYQNGSITTLTKKDGLPDDRLTALYEDGEGVLWIGTSGAGISRYKNGRFSTVTAKSGLFDDNVFRILEDAAGYFWMSCNRGIFRVARADLEAVLDGRRNKIQSVAYGVADGMKNVECNGETQPAGWKTRDGRLWFPTIKGAVVVDPAHLRSNALPPPVALESVVANGRSVTAAPGRSVVLEPGSSKLELHYAALSFPAVKRIRFKYRLDGFDTDWVDAGTERTAHYTNLPPRAYTFRVKACNGDGLWNETGAALELRLLPFFYQTDAFRILCAASVLALGFGVHRFRLRRLRRRAEELERIVEAQTHDLRVANERLQRAQEQLARLSEANPEKLENVSAWGTSMAEQIREAIRAERVDLWRAEGDALVAVSEGATSPPAWEAVQAARIDALGSSPGPAIVAVKGLTDELRGALVIEGPVIWGETERRLVAALAEHLGGALDLQHLRDQLTTTAARQAEMRRLMRERGVHTLKLCPRCGRCHDDQATTCQADGSPLDDSRLLPYRLLDRYRLTYFLGEGGMGSVFEAHDEKLKRDVALKVIRAEMLTDAEARFRLEREAQALARIRHPSVIGLFDSGELEDGSAFLVMELLAGRDLGDVLLAHGAGAPAQVALLLRDVGAALKAAHQAGVIHRDVKPGNVFLVPADGTFYGKVLDFGLAKSTRAEARLTQSGMLIGTPAYMSPEQVEGRDVDVRTDVYSLATVAFEALTGRPLIPDGEVGRMLVDVLYTTPPLVSTLLPGIGPGVDRAFEAALAKRPTDRPSDIEAWARGLSDLLGTIQPLGPGWPLQGLTRKAEFGSKRRAASTA